MHLRAQIRFASLHPPSVGPATWRCRLANGTPVRAPQITAYPNTPASIRWRWQASRLESQGHARYSRAATSFQLCVMRALMILGRKAGVFTK